MASSRIDFVRGISRQIEIDLVDDDGERFPLEDLEGAVAVFTLRVAPSDASDVLSFTSPSTGLDFKAGESALVLSFDPSDTAALALLVYVFRIRVTLADGTIFNAVDWSPFDLNLGGVAVPAQPVFDETTALNHNYGLDDALRYMTPGGSPIANAHVRVYYQTDYVAGNLGSPVGTTTTKADGRWVNTLMVRPGFTYVVQFQKPNEYGPDIATIVA
jgi:hypothetical protein